MLGLASGRALGSGLDAALGGDALLPDRGRLRLGLGAGGRGRRWRRRRVAGQRELTREQMPVLAEHQVDSLPDVHGDRHLGALVQHAKPFALLRGHVDRRRDLGLVSAVDGRACRRRAGGGPPGPEGSLGKLASSVIARQAARVHALIAGPHGMLVPGSPLDGTIAPLPDGRALTLFSDPAASAKEIERFSKKDAASYIELHNSLTRLGEILSQVLTLTPPVIEDPSNEDLWKLLKLGKKVRGLGKKEMMRLIRWGPMAAADFVAEFFETDLLRAAVAARGIFGAALGPWSAGSTTLLVLRAAADPYPVGNSAMPRGGMGALTAAMAASAKQAGAEIRTNADVQKILVKNGAVIAIALASGEEIAAKCVVSGADPRRTLLGLILLREIYSPRRCIRKDAFTPRAYSRLTCGSG